ncbi:hypothetical protein PENANT_c166G06650 [Penicillium antarcticum]|uniref:Cation-transporting P-type ATPase C-terminal domain-containing protein n=1 Tax=Penicillium antarcticum TaxID=416450 RepID=A0A1V6PCF8_9EURO|nr:hypothetical protein PENANT_c166G06650 [Penicillium antarcticum]
MPMFDPPSEDTASTIAEAQDLGISVKVLTGYATAISKGTCKMLAMGRKFCNSKRLVGGLNGAMAGEMVEKADGFAEDFPEHKYQVVDMLQECGHLTAMADDGANDAPSLKKAMWYCRGSSLPQTLEVSLALFADLATMAVACDNASYERRPVEWQLPKIWIISAVLGILLAAGTWEIVFLEIALTENWLIIVTMGGATQPSLLLVIAIAGVDVLATCFCLSGWF